MSRETDTPSSGPNGRGGAAYPSGTPPYGTPMASDDGTDAGRSVTRPEEKKTETTLTTRIRINIPGSRPIPPVVVRKPVGDTDGAGDEAPARDTRPAADRSATGSVEPPAEPAAQAEEKTSDWFAPRKSSGGKAAPATGGTNGSGTSGGSSTAPGSSGTRSGGPGASGASGTTGARSGGRPGGVVGSMSVPGASRSGTGTGTGKGLPGATGGPVAPGHGGGTGSFDVTEALNAAPRGTASRPGASGGEPRRDDLPYFSENGGQDDFDGTGTAGSGSGTAGAGGHDGFGTPGADGRNGFPGTPGAPGANGLGGLGGPGGPSGFNGPRGHGGPGGPQGPAGPTSGPVTGDGPLVPSAGEPFDGLSGTDGRDGPGGYDGPGRPGAQPPRSALADIADLEGPAGPGAPAAGSGAAGLGPGGGLSDDTAILTPQKPAPEPGTPGYRPADNVSGHTVTSGIPVVPGAGASPFGTPAGGPATQPQSRPEPSGAPKAQAKPKKKGRSKLVLLGAGVVVVAGGAYGAGLLMNHTDVPKGTTVLGVDIGGGTRDDAVKKLDDAFGGRVNKPLKLSVGGNTVTLTPENAGLQFDFQATVSKAATSDYNPVHVIGSLFGQKRVIDPEMPVDEEKLQAALQQAGGGSGSVVEGGIDFKPGQAVAVYGKAGKAIDAAQSTQAVEQAYRTLVETGTPTPVTVPTTTKQPTVSNAAVDQEMKLFAEPAMSAKVTVSAGAGHVVLMSPEKSLWKFLKVVPTSDGKLVDKPDLNALKQLYGKAFDGVLITRGNGSKTPVTPQDVYAALRQALISRTNRVAVISTHPS
ncbi:hypothetical protein FB563_1696 [Streptomyces puniciscabiei]|uniref:Uncharacterized protein n=1 Tax=Streptomyces puniciscabiei TaxID=164348 RepID=A0A542UCE2_9ACTN|nr:hypothetical protein [Streptomyces puniciscabiei]TQK96747.1 hypothetical protein FB563_1696 [Streptomyces puniciscabiei]